MPNVKEHLETVANILLWCMGLGFLLLLLWFGAYLLLPGVIYQQHGQLFDLTPHEINLIHYGGMAFVKLCVLLFFAFPYLAIRIVLRKSKA